MNKKNLIGKRFGRLVVIAEIKKRKNNRIHWECICDCGNKKVISGGNLGRTTFSCGCFSRESSKKNICKMNKTHGMTKTITYGSWCAMKCRCLDKKHPAYERYGGRGITICKRWMKFENFYADMGDRPKERTLDRKNNNLGYYKGNCQWSTTKEQNLNRSDNRMLTLNKIKMTMREWSEKIGIKYSTLSMRINHSGWSEHRALTTPVRKRSQ